MKRRNSTLNRTQKRFWKIFFATVAVISLIVGFYSFSQYLKGQSSVLSQTNTNSLSQTNTNSNCGSPSGGPTDNPIASLYGNNAYPWTKDMKWGCVYNIKDFNGSKDRDRFNAARDAAVAGGGGVIYFPAGTYNFNDSIQIADGVIIRGETPGVKDAKSDSYQPPTKLVFPKYEPKLSGSGTPNDTAFKKITTARPDKDSNIGIVNVDINRAAIAFKADIDSGTNQNVVVFGVRSNNVAEPDPTVPDTSFQEAWQRYSYRFATNIKLNAFANALVANNRVNDNITDNYDQPGYKIKARKKNSIITFEGGEVPFHYGNHYGIAVNRGKSSGFKNGATPEEEPGLFRKGIVIRDNWVYHTMRVAIYASGDGLIIKDNIIKDRSGKQWWVDPTGKKETTGAVTLENRAIDWSGSNVLVDGNNYEVYRHKIGNSKYLSTDGEGILAQECCGGTIIDGVTISNNQGNAYIGLYKVRDIKNAKIIGNELNSNVTNTSLIYVVADTNYGSFSVDNVLVKDNTVAGSILVKGSAGGRGNVIEDNVGNGRGNISYSCSVNEVKNNRGFEVQPCS
ncbi:MAG: hypothetical protein SXA11_23965 [Cyanobacteriota bacterium]|nr:hypothetical protein [Cyanobacteriota bacterium]